MGSAGICPESKKSEVLIRELIKGRESVKGLQVLLREPFGDDGSSERASEFLVEILRSLDQGLCLLGGPSDQIGENALNSSVGHHQVSAFTFDSGVDSSRTKKRPAMADRRGCYERRNSSHTRMTVTRTLEDGQAWRKYGQKVILNAKFPRSYFRCTHKNDRSCKATKQVQMMEDGSGMYRTKYTGFHTCNRDPIRPPQLIAPNYGPEGNDYIIFPEDGLKEETCRDHVDSKSDLTDNLSFGSLQDHSSFPRFELSPPRREDQGDISGMYMSGVDDDGSHSEMELLARGPVGFLGDFYFDESNLS